MTTPPLDPITESLNFAEGKFVHLTLLQESSTCGVFGSLNGVLRAEKSKGRWRVTSDPGVIFFHEDHVNRITPPEFPGGTLTIVIIA